MKAKSPLEEWNFKEAMILTNAIKYFPNIPHMESSSFCKLHFASKIFHVFG
jgi:hypothetical protein